jgi:hypothetical protein
MPTHEEGFARLRNLLDAATGGDRATFEALFARLQEVLREILTRLEHEFAGQIDRVLAAGEWGERGIDLRNLPYDEVVLLIVLSGETRPFERYQQIANRVFADLHDGDVFVQFALLALPEWQRAEAATRAWAVEEALGTLLWAR